MRGSKGWVAVVVASVGLAVAQARGAGFTAQVLNPISENGVAYGGSGGTVVGTTSAPYVGQEMPTLWSGGKEINLLPKDAYTGVAWAASGNTQVGQVGESPFVSPFLWHGSAASGVDLTPARFTSGAALGVAGNQQVGWVQNGKEQRHAAMWSGSAKSFVDLNSDYSATSTAYATDGITQIGSAAEYTPEGNVGSYHAALWRGSADSFVDLNPKGADYSVATAVAGDLQGGFVVASLLNYQPRATIWKGTADSAIDLTPKGFAESEIAGMFGTFQVGYAVSDDDGLVHAMLWNSSAFDFIDLSTDLPASLKGLDIYGSFATGIDEYGNVTGYIYADDYSVAVQWSPSGAASVVPEAGVPSLGLGGTVLIVLRRRARRRDTAVI